MSFFQKMKDIIVNNIAEIYEITYNNKTYYYTNLDYDFEYNDKVYKAKSIRRSNIKRDENVFSGELDFSLPKNDEVSKIFQKNGLFVPVFIKIYGVTRGSLIDDRALLYTGYINSAKTDEAVTDFSCNTNEILTDKQIIRYRFGYNCQNDLYDQKCLLNEDDFKTLATITNIEKNYTLITLDSDSGKPDGYFNNGYIKVNGVYSPTITEHTGNQITLFHPFDDIEIGQEIAIHAGCNRTSTDCINKFNNFENFFGFEHVPNRNPMNGRIL